MLAHKYQQFSVSDTDNGSILQGTTVHVIYHVSIFEEPPENIRVAVPRCLAYNAMPVGVNVHTVEYNDYHWQHPILTLVGTNG